jgi:hypothetical protein
MIKLPLVHYFVVSNSIVFYLVDMERKYLFHTELYCFLLNQATINFYLLHYLFSNASIFLPDHSARDTSVGQKIPV